MVGHSGDIDLKIVAGSVCRKLPAKSTGAYYGHVSYRSYYACSSESDSEGRQIISIQILICRKDTVVVDNANIHLDYNN